MVRKCNKNSFYRNSKMKCEMKNDQSYQFTEFQIEVLDSSRIAIKIGLEYVNECASRFNFAKPKISVSHTQLKAAASKLQSLESSEFTDMANCLIQLETK